MKIYTVDEFQEKKFSMMIFNIVNNDRFDFFLNFKHLFSAVNRVRNDLIIVYNQKDFDSQSDAHHRFFIIF